ncbi:protein SMG5 isoform X2 [Contarinia nasturtii]|uniref:protein SMG5 isoform X2 n=1 Tax=Contarinia nasturtii TaxID=265458 RepID=UPI0012D44958|nr:protein SMG5 isoform X2 [Contarinia nasturtii]
MTMDYSTTTSMISKPFAAAAQPLDRDIKQQYKCVYNLLKQFEQEKQKIKSIDGIFDGRIESLRNSIVDQSTALIYQTEFEVIGRKCREILWFKGYYDLISLAKRLWKKNQTNSKQAEEQISNLIIEGISHFKLIIVNLERKFSLDLRDVVDFSFLDTCEKNLYTAVASQNSICHNENRTQDEVTKYAMETIHALLISLGDLHRYFIDFDFTMPKISKDFAANYYFEAFKLNPKTGMAQNQLGTLLAGSTYNLDSIYHYLYSLTCPVPFELSDSRVVCLFQNNASYLEKNEGSNEKCDTIGLRDFIARYLLVIDVFFYDKEINDFNSLCHCMLLDFRKMLQSQRVDLSGEILYKMIATFFFCLIKLKTIGSNKIHSLNAFLVALCSELVSACTMKLNKFIEGREAQNAKFQAKYLKNFEDFEQTVRDAREKHKRYIESLVSSASHTNDESNDTASVKGHLNGKLTINKLSDDSFFLRNGHKFNLNGHDDMATNSSGRERESDAGKSTPLSSSQTKNQKRRGNFRRRRRRMVSEHSNSDLSYFEDSECEMDTDFGTDEDSADENADDSWYTSESEEEEENVMENGSKSMNGETKHNSQPQSNDDDDDVIIEDEQIIYPSNGVDQKQPEESLNQPNNYEHSIFGDFMSSFKQLQLFDEETTNGQNNFTFDKPSMANPFDFQFKLIDNVENTLCNGETSSNNTTAPEKLRFKQKYNKIDPNIIIEFFQHENTMVALKLLFDWLRGNSAIIVNCFTTNPEFIEKIFDLLNAMNIDVFTRKVYFERSFIEIDDVRESLRSLFDMRQTIPMKEDVLLKEFAVFDLCQRHMDWTLPLKLKITENEETILRIFLFIDFGFSLCKMKKFDYNFCSRTRNFIKVISTKQRSMKRIRKRGRRNRRRVRNRSRNRQSNGTELCVLSRNGEQTGRSSTDDGHHIDDDKKPNLKKGYLKNRQQNNQANVSPANGEQSNATSAAEKHQLMGKLWLKHEIEVLEAKMSKNILSPYLVVDSKVLSHHLEIVKKLVKAKKFVVLIPSAVLAELDELKKTSDGVRNTIRWLEREFTNGGGSRFIRLQRNNETKSIALIKVPKKLDREASTFMHIAQFCNYINDTHVANGENILDASMAKPNVVTFLTGGKLIDKKLSNISFTGILDAIGINYEQINEFYAKYKMK